MVALCTSSGGRSTSSVGGESRTSVLYTSSSARIDAPCAGRPQAATARFVSFLSWCANAGAGAGMANLQERRPHEVAEGRAERFDGSAHDRTKCLSIHDT